MSQPSEPEDVKLFSSLFSPRAERIPETIREMEEWFGPADWVSREMVFDRTRYYEREMGWPLCRRFATFERLIRPDEIVEVKERSNGIEARHLQDRRRRINIDPGYVSLERVVLATGKNYIHRIYLSRGIYADLTLLFRRGTFEALKWTYPDYGSPEMIQMFNDIRRRYKEQLRGPREAGEALQC